MADPADEADIHIENERLEREWRIREQVSKMPKGEPGDCDICGHWSGRLVQGACAPCRDKYNLP